MKFTQEQAIMATLDLMLEMAAKNMAFHEAILSSMCQTDEELEIVLKTVKERAADNLILLRAKAYEFASVNPDDLLNGTFDI
jgi:hypothetical protein